MPKKVIDQDLVKVSSSANTSKLLTTLAWGDEIELLGESEKFFEIKTEYYIDQPDGSFKKGTRAWLDKENHKAS